MTLKGKSTDSYYFMRWGLQVLKELQLLKLQNCNCATCLAQTQTHERADAHTYAHTHARMHTHQNVYTHKRTHARPHTHTCTTQNVCWYERTCYLQIAWIWMIIARCGHRMVVVTRIEISWFGDVHGRAMRARNLPQSSIKAMFSQKLVVLV